MKWKTIYPWFALAFNVFVTAWLVYQNDALAAVVSGAVLSDVSPNGTV